jgi:hypothetical protein
VAKLGEWFTSRSHGFPFSSIRISNLSLVVICLP